MNAVPDYYKLLAAAIDQAGGNYVPFLCYDNQGDYDLLYCSPFFPTRVKNGHALAAHAVSKRMRSLLLAILGKCKCMPARRHLWSVMEVVISDAMEGNHYHLLEGTIDTLRNTVAQGERLAIKNFGLDALAPPSVVRVKTEQLAQD
jgi:hypothetical protein